MRCLSFVFLILITISALWSQTEAKYSAQAFPVAEVSNDQVVPLGINDEVIALTRRQAASLMEGEPIWTGQTLLPISNLGWSLVTHWKQGDERLALRFELIRQQNQWLLLEVGAWQACRCIDCSIPEFVEQGIGCDCPENTDCTFLLGDTSH